MIANLLPALEIVGLLVAVFFWTRYVGSDIREAVRTRAVKVADE